MTANQDDQTHLPGGPLFSDSESRSFWNTRSAQWTERTRSEKMVRRLETMVRFIQRVSAACTCLDVGCGEGSLCLALKEKGYRVSGCDVSENLVDITRAKLGPDADVRVIENNRIPFDGPFDLICVLGVLVYVPEHERYLRHLSECLRPGGLIVVSCTQRRSLRAGWDIIRNLARPRLHRGWLQGLGNLFRTGVWSGGLMPYRGSGRIYSADGLERLLRRTGYQPIDRFYVYDFEALDRHPLARSRWGRYLARRFGWRQTIAARWEGGP